ncbi:MAG: phosphoribosyltransferase family protein [Candidatus Dormibacteraeota bacterium]|jgi:hypoxanthine phosphoribosyltransferase|nr:phosphoribosyltransferase family protein [Candidatus Dormibacteraeota bacterium]
MEASPPAPQLLVPVLEVPAPKAVGQLSLWNDPAVDQLPVREIASADMVRERVCALAEQIATELGGEPLTLAVVLRGAFVFAADLARELITNKMENLLITFFHASSYRGTKAWRAPVIQELGDLSADGKQTVLIIDDIVDAGHTAAAMIERLSSPSRRVEYCSLLDRPEAREAPVHPRYVGFRLAGPGFVVGYGLDYDDKYRELPYLAQWMPPPGLG